MTKIVEQLSALSRQQSWDLYQAAIVDGFRAMQLQKKQIDSGVVIEADIEIYYEGCHFDRDTGDAEAIPEVGQCKNLAQLAVSSRSTFIGMGLASATLVQAQYNFGLEDLLLYRKHCSV